jgi:hypothetical protein
VRTTSFLKLEARAHARDEERKREDEPGRDDPDDEPPSPPLQVAQRYE